MSTITLTAKSKVARVSNGDTVVLPNITNLAAGFSVVLQTASNSDVITVQPYSGQSIEHRLGSVSKTNGLYGIKLVRNNSTDWSFISDFDLRDENHGDVRYPVVSEVSILDTTPLKITTTPHTLTGNEVNDIWLNLDAGNMQLYLPPTPADGKSYRIHGHQTGGYSTVYTGTVWGNGKTINFSTTNIIQSGDVLNIKYDAATNNWTRIGGVTLGSNLVSASYPDGPNGTYTNTFQTHFQVDTGTVSLITYGNYTSQMVRHANSAAGNVDYTLEPAQGSFGDVHRKDKVWIIQKVAAANLVTITPDGVQTINGNSSMTLTELGETIAIQDGQGHPGGDWKILWHYKPSLIAPWESANVFGVNAGTTILAHTLGIVPRQIWFEALCIADDNGWVAGERIRIPYSLNASVDADSSNIYIYWGPFSANALGPTITNKITRLGPAQSSTSTWAWKVKAF